MAALVVALQHFVETQNVRYFRWSTEVFRPGEFGVIVFFLTSGYIIPVSIERYKSVPRFWVGRFFRLYPLYWAIVGAAVVLYAFDRFGLPPDLRLHWLRASAANATMAQEFIGQPHVLGQAWTLSYELVFYTMVSVLFLTGQAQRPARAALFWLAAAVLVGTMPARLLSAGTTDQRLTVLAVAAVAGLVAAF